MRIDDFSEIVLIQMKRKNLKMKDLAKLIGKSSVYTKQVIDGVQYGPKAQEYKKQIAEYLGIVLASE
ncbi:hypothetical protein MMJ52_02320 [Enterococcus cecorum]|uniref:hypothetical protein n=1 Tax=Enterococcus cecorum TaxID=44008 RepID=UPI00148C0E42|nr:hypothetical protein [Enterococcus cecorum]MCJ0543105.1 hypothetical protein [Enterococcus cecorum]MCJ0547612.1 hypothetical protein [Enterococcus cecorum]MCJ0597706.1 hypothetical protein [Enterococcus cecorum]